MLNKQFSLLTVILFLAGAQAVAENNLCKKIADDLIQRGQIGKSTTQLDTLWVDKKTESVDELLKPYKQIQSDIKNIEQKLATAAAMIAVEETKVKEQVALGKDEEWVSFAGFHEKSLSRTRQGTSKLLILKKGDSDAAQIRKHNDLKKFVLSSCGRPYIAAAMAEECFKAEADLKTLEMSLSEYMKFHFRNTDRSVADRTDTLKPALADLTRLHGEASGLNSKLILKQHELSSFPFYNRSKSAPYELLIRSHDRYENGLKVVSLQSTGRVPMNQPKLAELKKREASLVNQLGGFDKLYQNHPDHFNQLKNSIEIEDLKKIADNSNLPEYVRTKAKLKLSETSVKQAAVIQISTSQVALRQELETIQSQIQEMKGSPLIQMVMKGDEIVSLNVSSPVGLKMWNGCRDFSIDSFNEHYTGSYRLGDEKDPAKRMLVQKLFDVNSDEQIDKKYGAYRNLYPESKIHSEHLNQRSLATLGDAPVKKYLEWAIQAKSHDAAPPALVSPEEVAR